MNYPDLEELFLRLVGSFPGPSLGQLTRLAIDFPSLGVKMLDSSAYAGLIAASHDWPRFSDVEVVFWETESDAVRDKAVELLLEDEPRSERLLESAPPTQLGCILLECIGPNSSLNGKIAEFLSSNELGPRIELKLLLKLMQSEEGFRDELETLLLSGLLSLSDLVALVCCADRTLSRQAARALLTKLAEVMRDPDPIEFWELKALVSIAEHVPELRDDVTALLLPQIHDLRWVEGWELILVKLPYLREMMWEALRNMLSWEKEDGQKCLWDNYSGPLGCFVAFSSVHRAEAWELFCERRKSFGGFQDCESELCLIICNAEEMQDEAWSLFKTLLSSEQLTEVVIQVPAVREEAFELLLRLYGTPNEEVEYFQITRELGHHLKRIERSVESLSARAEKAFNERCERTEDVFRLFPVRQMF